MSPTLTPTAIPSGKPTGLPTVSTANNVGLYFQRVFDPVTQAAFRRRRLNVRRPVQLQPLQQPRRLSVPLLVAFSITVAELLPWFCYGPRSSLL
jgi:hypothetical protein